MKTSVGILGLGTAVPDHVLTNSDLEKIVDTNDEWIRTRTGIRERRIAAPEEATSDLGSKAATVALARAGLTAADLDLIIVATITPDMPFPATACIIQNNIQAVNASAFDLGAGCSGFIYGLEVGRQMVQGGYRRVLVVGADTLSRVTDYQDRSTCVLFGDGAAAAVLGQVEPGYGLIGSQLGSDGSRGHHLAVPAGGSAKPATMETVANREHYVKMNGNEVFKFAVRIMAESTSGLLDTLGMSADTIRWFVPHQANTRIISAAAQRLGITDERVYVNVERFGNTSAASVGLALDELIQNGKVEQGDFLLLVGFGAGLTWGSTVLRWSTKEVIS